MRRRTASCLESENSLESVKELPLIALELKLDSAELVSCNGLMVIADGTYIVNGDENGCTCAVVNVCIVLVLKPWFVGCCNSTTARIGVPTTL